MFGILLLLIILVFSVIYTNKKLTEEGDVVLVKLIDIKKGPKTKTI